MRYSWDRVRVVGGSRWERVVQPSGLARRCSFSGLLEGNMKDEVLSLNADDIDVELLEQRIEMSSLLPVVNDGSGCDCRMFSCATFQCLPN